AGRTHSTCTPSTRAIPGTSRRISAATARSSRTTSGVRSMPRSVRPRRSCCTWCRAAVRRGDPVAERHARRDRSTPPPLGDPPDVRMPPVHRRTLDNGLEVLAVPLRALPVVDVRLVLRSGATADPAGREGLASFAAEMIDEGTTQRSALELADAFDYLGARLHVEASFDATTFSLHVLSPRLPDTLAL